MTQLICFVQKRLLIFGLLFFISLMLQTNQAGAVDVQEDDPNWLKQSSMEKSLVQSLVKWIAKNSYFTNSTNDFPDVKYVTLDKLVDMAFGKEASNYRKQKHKHEILGLYSFREKAIYLLDSLDLQTIKGKGILLHELVHYMQYENGREQDVSCINTLETLAYRLEAKYLRENEQEYSSYTTNLVNSSICTS